MTTKEQREQIRKDFHDGKKVAEIAKEQNLNYRYVYQLCKGKTHSKAAEAAEITPAQN